MAMAFIPMREHKNLAALLVCYHSSHKKRDLFNLANFVIIKMISGVEKRSETFIIYWFSRLSCMGEDAFMYYLDHSSSDYY